MPASRQGTEHPGLHLPPGGSVPWHIQPDAHEFDYELDGALTLETDGEGSKVMKRGDAVYVAPNVVHRGVNVSRTQAAKISWLGVKPKDQPLTKEVQP
jgi:quercetin dioxygenase-like cupin family protein